MHELLDDIISQSDAQCEIFTEPYDIKSAIKSLDENQSRLFCSINSIRKLISDLKGNVPDEIINRAMSWVNALDSIVGNSPKMNAMCIDVTINDLLKFSKSLE